MRRWRNHYRKPKPPPEQMFKVIVHLLDEEKKILDEKAQKHFMSRAYFFRAMILNEQLPYRGDNRLGRDGATAALRELSHIGTNISIIECQFRGAYHDKKRRGIIIPVEMEEVEILRLKDYYAELLSQLYHWAKA